MNAFHRTLAQARAEGRALLAFNCYNLESVSAAVAVAARTGTPLIVAHGERYLENIGLRAMRALVTALVQDAGCGGLVLLHLDHSASPELCIQAAELGYDSVMYDGSHLPYAENLTNTAAVVQAAHSLNVGVEAELGALGIGDASHEFETGHEALTDPAQAQHFAAETGIDALAVSIGTVHGLYRSAPKLDLERLSAIAALVPLPLVLHGGSGTPRDALNAAIRLGIAKINVNTEVALAGSAAVLARAQVLGPGQAHAAALGLAQQEAMTASMLGYVRPGH
ncbi:class II fructose-bisphosphate aldolase [Deinococcus radiomollis]|uniref:class II fructose-bisphosphate aldolase n=1 Tax=Deinococcus radiomollis TaxID=468916 RepID=UPI003892BD00